MKAEVQKYINVKEIEERLNMWSLSEGYYYGSKNTSQNRTWIEEGTRWVKEIKSNKKMACFCVLSWASRHEYLERIPRLKTDFPSCKRQTAPSLYYL